MAAQPNRDSTLLWRKSSASGGTNECIEVATSGPFVLVRNSRDRSGIILELTFAQWRALLLRIKTEGMSLG